MILRVFLLVVAFQVRSVLGQENPSRPECVLWSKLENKTVPLQNQGHANCTTNPDCTGFDCVGLYQERELSFGMRVLPCNKDPGVQIFGFAPQFSDKNFSHIFSHEDVYEIPSSFMNASVLTNMMSQVPQLEGMSREMKGRLAVSLKMDHNKNILTMGLTFEACINETCLLKLPIFNDSEIPVPPCSNHPLATESPKTNSVCSVADLSSCGENQLCEQQSPDSSIGTCQCRSGFSYETDGSCKPVEDRKVPDEIKLDEENEVENKRDKKAAASTIPSPEKIADGPSGGAIAAAVISVIVVVVLLTGAAFYIVMRTRLVPRIRARMTNTPYECANLSQPPPQGATLP